MIKLAIKLGTLAPILMALSTAPSLTPAFAAGGQDRRAKLLVKLAEQRRVVRAVHLEGIKLSPAFSAFHVVACRLRKWYAETSTSGSCCQTTVTLCQHRQSFKVEAPGFAVST